MVEVILVHHKDAGLLLLQDDLCDLSILHLGSLCTVDHEEAKVGALDALDGLIDGENLHRFVDLSLLPDAGGIDEDVVVLIDRAADVQRVACRAGDLAHDGALFAENGIDDRGLARVGPSNDGQFERTGVSLQFDRLSFVVASLEIEFFTHHADKFIDAQTMCGADLDLFFKTQARELRSTHLSLR